jgi:plastocyanin
MKRTTTTERICLLALFVLLVSCTSPTDAATVNAASEEPAVVTHTVLMKGMKFTPAEIRVQKGNQIVFFNVDIVTHNVTEATKKAWASPPIPPGESWTLTPRQSDAIYCSLHPMMKGSIIIE